MTAAARPIDAPTYAAASARDGWLYSPIADRAILFVPFVVVAAGLFIETAQGHGASPRDRGWVAWVAQFVLGNTTHVVLSFLLLGTRRELLRSTPSQSRLLGVGSTLAFAAAAALFWLTSVTFPIWGDFGLAIAFVFSVQHRLSQTKGIWALYNMRAGTRPSPREQALQKNMVPVGLLLLSVRLLFVPNARHTTFPLLQAIPGLPAVLPFSAAYVITGAWLVYALFILRAIWAGSSRAKRLYVATNCVATAVAAYSPVWGGALVGGIHGLEYYFLSARMLERKPDESTGPRGATAWLFVAMAIAPAVAVGVFLCPWGAGLAQSDAARRAVLVAHIGLSSVVMAHYFADAFIYRFRVPSIRKVALHRMGF